MLPKASNYGRGTGTMKYVTHSESTCLFLFVVDFVIFIWFSSIFCFFVCSVSDFQVVAAPTQSVPMVLVMVRDATNGIATLVET